MISHHRWTAMIAVIVLCVPSGAEPPATPVDARVEAVAAMAAQTPGQAASPQTPNTQAPNPQPPAEPGQASPNEVSVIVGKSVIVSTAQPIERISVGYNDVAEATAVSPREVLVNGKSVGETSLIVWQRDGNKLFFDLRVRPNNFVNETRTELVRQQLKKELAGSSINLSFENDTAFLRGTVRDLTSADRAVAIASTLGKTVNLLYVNVPAADAQILLKVRFASVDRSVSSELGLNLVSTGATNTIGRVTTGQFSPPSVSATGTGNNGPGRGGTSSTVTLSDALNIFLLRPDLNLAATIRAFESRGLVEILAEPNVLAINGRQANFLAGGEFPYPILQGGGAGLGTVTIAFREFGVRINFIPTLTPRGTLRLEVAPEVSALDFANGLVFQGFNIPALTVRRVHTSIELNAGQSFAIGGLLDNRMTETLEKLPLLGDIPILGKLFRSRALRRDNTELLVLITPELVRPIPAGQPTPELNLPKEFLKPNTNKPIRTPGTDITGMVPVTPPQEAVPVEQLIQSLRQPKLEGGTGAAGLPDTNYQAPNQLPPFPAPATSAPTQAPPAPAPTTPK
jgi:pilus assembly protein CpaC